VTIFSKRRPSHTVRARSVAAAIVVVAIVLSPAPQSAVAQAPEDILAGAFDKITGVPFASTMLGIVRAGESSPRTPAALDARLTVLETLLRDMEPRLQLVELRVKQLQNEVVKLANVGRLRELHRIRGELAAITAELKLKPADPTRRAILEFRAQQQADAIKDTVAFDIWKWSDVSNGLVRTRFVVYPAFELYALATTTWFAAIELGSGSNPQRVAEQAAAFRRHAAFLTARPAFQDLLDEPIALPEHLRTAAFCRLEAVDRFSKAGGACLFASVCIDTMAETREETGRLTLTMNPASPAVLCTFDPKQSLGLEGEAKLHASYGAELMAALARDYDRLATTGSLAEPFVGRFPGFVQAQIFSVPLASPVLAASAAALGSLPAVPPCIRSVSGGCSWGVKLSAETGWTFSNVDRTITGGGGGEMYITHNGSSLCLDVKDGVAAAGASAILFACNGTASQVWTRTQLNNVHYTLASGKSGLCATVGPAAPSGLLQLRRSLTLQSCDGRALQQFSNTDGTSSPVK